MRAVGSLLFCFTLLSAIYLFAVPQRHIDPEAMSLSRMEQDYERGGEHYRGWPLTYLTYDAEHGNSKATYYNFTYNYGPIDSVSLMLNIVFFGIFLLLLNRYPELSANQLWVTTAFYFAAVAWYYLQITGSFYPQLHTPFHVRVIGPNQGIHIAIFSVLTISLFFVIGRMVAILSDLMNSMKSGNSRIAR